MCCCSFRSVRRALAQLPTPVPTVTTLRATEVEQVRPRLRNFWVRRNGRSRRLCAPPNPTCLRPISQKTQAPGLESGLRPKAPHLTSKLVSQLCGIHAVLDARARLEQRVAQEAVPAARCQERWGCLAHRLRTSPQGANGCTIGLPGGCILVMRLEGCHAWRRSTWTGCRSGHRCHRRRRRSLAERRRTLGALVRAPRGVLVLVAPLERAALPDRCTTGAWRGRKAGSHLLGCRRRLRLCGRAGRGPIATEHFCIHAIDEDFVLPLGSASCIVALQILAAELPEVVLGALVRDSLGMHRCGVCHIQEKTAWG